MVKVYSITNCPWCDKLKKYLKSKGVDYEEHNIETNEDDLKECIRLTNDEAVPVTTADGRSIDFNVEVSMSREFIEYTGVHISETSVMTDPLVLNLDGNPASVSDQKFYFDIDADGKSELIPTLSGGSGLLALDRNADGTINDGSELFGTKSGDAFTDLAEFDLDGNGWIDEADEVFAKLSIWSFGADGAMKQISLKDAGIGAIGLKNVSTGFSLNNAQTNATEAVIRKTGMFLFENGRAGTAQQMDFAIA